MRHRDRLSIYALVALISFGIGVLIGNEIGKARELAVKVTDVREGYSLLTWESSDHDLCFVLVPKNKFDSFIANWFVKWNHNCGAIRLMEELSTLPPGTYVEWNDDPPRFVYPRDEVVTRLSEYAHSRGIDWHVKPVIVD